MLGIDLDGLLLKQKHIGKYVPLYEAVTNAIQAIAEKKESNGKIVITANRIQISSSSNTLSDIVEFIIKDNGIGFNNENLDSFNKLYSTKKIEIGGKGFGRISYLKNFRQVKIESNYIDQNGDVKKRQFKFSKVLQGISDPIEEVSKTNSETGSIVKLQQKRQNISFNKHIETIGRKLVEHFLLLFAEQPEFFPKIIIKNEEEGEIDLNKYFKETTNIIDEGEESLVIGEGKNKHNFSVRCFKIFYSDNLNIISLCAQGREVETAKISNLIPEFKDRFEEVREEGEKTTSHHFVIKAYVQGRYLDVNTSDNRTKFNFHKEGNDPLYDLSQKVIENATATIINKKFKELICDRIKRKEKRVNDYIDKKAPWYKPFREDLDFSDISEDISDEGLSIKLYKLKSDKFLEVNKEVQEYLSPDSLSDDSKKEVRSNILKKVTDIGKSDLIHYVINRKIVLQLFKQSLEKNEEGGYVQEDDIHSIIFPTKADSEGIDYNDHNLWIIDEKLNFSTFLSSDKIFGNRNQNRADILVFGKQVVFREGNKKSSPVTIFEFKRPNRDDFTNPSSKEDPIEQIIRYRNQIVEGKYKTPKGREIKIGETTPFYGFVVCTLTKKVTKWLFNNKNFKQMPDGDGWYQWYDNNNLHIQVLSWDKLLEDSEQRNKIFFEKLGIN